MKKSLFYLITLMCCWLLLETFSFFALVTLKNFKDITYQPFPKIELSTEQKDIITQFMKDGFRYTSYHASLGWTVKPNSKEGKYQSNAQGIRANREYALKPSPDIVRIATFGDSFTYGSEVENKDTWQENLMKMNSKLEVLNFGVGGYGLDQAYLRYQQEGIAFNPNIVLICLTSENIGRSINVFRPFYYSKTGLPLTKPRFIIKNNQLTLLKNPFQKLQDYNLLIQPNNTILSTLGKNDEYYQYNYYKGIFDFLPSVKLIKILGSFYHRSNYMQHHATIAGFYNVHSEAYKILILIIEEFYAEVLNQNGTPLVIILPHRYDFQRFYRNQVPRHQPLINQLENNKMHYIDLLNPFMKNKDFNDPNEVFGFQHYSLLGNKLVAKYILDYLTNKIGTIK